MKIIRGATVKKKLGTPSVFYSMKDVPSEKIQNVISVCHSDDGTSADYGFIGITNCNVLSYLVFNSDPKQFFPAEAIVTGIHRIY